MRPNEGLILSRMRTSASFVLITVCLLVHSTVGITEMINPDHFYFPDQAEYIKLAAKCPDKLILWPHNRQCYKEGEQGPCNFGRVLVFDRRLLKPYCEEMLYWENANARGNVTDCRRFYCTSTVCRITGDGSTCERSGRSVFEQGERRVRVWGSVPFSMETKIFV